MDGGSSVLSSSSSSNVVASTEMQAGKGVNSALSLLELEGQSRDTINGKKVNQAGSIASINELDNVNNGDAESRSAKGDRKDGLGTSGAGSGVKPNTVENTKQFRSGRENDESIVPPYLDSGLPNPEAYRDQFDDEIEKLEAADRERKENDKEFEEQEALRQRKLQDLRSQQMKYRIEGNTAEEATKEIGAEIDKLHGDETALVNAAISEGLVPPDGLEGRFAQDELAKEIRNIAAMMDIPDWLKEEDLAKQLKQEAVACRVKSRNLLQKSKARSKEANDALALVNEAIETTSRNSESAIERIEKRFKILREALDQREVELKEAVRHTTVQKMQSFRSQIQETESNAEMINAAVEKGKEAMDKDD